MLENWFSWSLVLNLMTSSTFSSKSKFDKYSFSSSIFKIINPDDVLTGFENCPVLSFETIFFMFLFKLSSLTHPIRPPFEAVSELLCFKAAFLNPILLMSKRIFSCFFLKFILSFSLKTISESRSSLWILSFEFFEISFFIFALSILTFSKNFW